MTALWHRASSDQPPLSLVWVALRVGVTKNEA